jgi:hypothetical protein
VSDEWDVPIIATALISEDLARALQESDESMERFRRHVADEFSKCMDAIMEEMLWGKPN